MQMMNKQSQNQNEIAILMDKSVSEKNQKINKKNPVFVLFFFLVLFVWFPCVIFPFLIISLTTLWIFIILFIKATKSGSPDSCMSEECIHIKRRRVTFNVDAQIHTVPSWRDYSLTERTAMWSSVREIKDMEKRYSLEVQKEKALVVCGNAASNTFANPDIASLSVSFCKTDPAYSQPIKVPEAPVKGKAESTFMDWEYDVDSSTYSLLELFDKVRDDVAFDICANPDVASLSVCFCKTDPSYSQPIKVPEAPVKRKVESTFMDWEYEVDSKNYNLIDLFNKVSDNVDYNTCANDNVVYSSSPSFTDDGRTVPEAAVTVDAMPEAEELKKKRSSRPRVSNGGPLRRSPRLAVIYPRRSPRLAAKRLAAKP